METLLQVLRMDLICHRSLVSKEPVICLKEFELCDYLFGFIWLSQNEKT